MATTTVALALLCATLLPRLAFGKKVSVASLDGTVTIIVDDETGIATDLETLGVKNKINGGSTLQGTIQLEVTVTHAGSDVVVENLVCIPAHDVPCSMYQVLVTDTYTPRSTSVGWITNISSPVTDGYPVPLCTFVLQDENSPVYGRILYTLTCSSAYACCRLWSV